MKKSALIIVGLSSFLIFGCENYKQQADQLQREKDSLVAETNINNQTIDEFVGAFNEVENNLSTITQKQNTIALNTARNPEMARSAKERINSDIHEINSIMAESKAKIDQLNKKMKNANFRAGKFEKLVAELKTQLAEKEKELALLNEQLGKLNLDLAQLKTTLDTMTIQNNQQAAVITDQTTKLHTAYIAVGPYKKLRDEQVVVKEGGFLGLGKQPKMNSTVKSDAFNKVDITQTSTIAINSKNPKIVTTHPSDSYKLEKNDKDLVSDIVITDPEKFWSASKYLVVVTQ